MSNNLQILTPPNSQTTQRVEPSYMTTPVRGWQTFSGGVVQNGKGGSTAIQLASMPVSIQYLRILMTQSSNTCDTHGSTDPRNCVGYAIREIYLGRTMIDA